MWAEIREPGCLRLVGMAAVLTPTVGISIASSLPVLAPSYLTAWLFLLGITLGCHAWIWIHHLTGGAWGVLIGRELRASARTLPLVLVAYLPIAWAVRDLYAWSHTTSEVGAGPWSADARWFQINAFYLRSFCYLAIWLFSSWNVGRLERRLQRFPTDANGRRLRSASARSLLAYGVTMTLAAYDWGMSLERHWYSAAYGILFVIGQGVAGLAWSIFAIRHHCVTTQGESTTRRSTNDLGNLLLAFTMLWAYISFSQFLIIWYADLPEEVIWYARRSQNGWQWIAIALATLHFAIPFTALLGQHTKRDIRSLYMVAAVLLVMRWVDLVWHVMPVFDTFRKTTTVIALATWFTCSLIWWIWYRWQRSYLADREPSSESIQE